MKFSHTRMSTIEHQILLADDDADDCIFFSEILEELPIKANLKIVSNGIALMNYLKENARHLPQVLFLDLNMPLKNGTECLEAIKADDELKQLPVIIISTSLNMEIVETLFRKGADYYICKPGDYNQLKNVILTAITKTSHYSQQPKRMEFVIE